MLVFGVFLVLWYPACLVESMRVWYLLICWSAEFDLSAGRPGDQSIHRVFVDPGGSHCIATVVGQGGAETFYTHAKWTKPRVLSKLKGLVVNAVAWNRQQITEGSQLITYLTDAYCVLIYVQQRISHIHFCVRFWFNFQNVVSTKEVILGTENGQLHELAVDEKDKKEKYIKFLFELTELPEAFMGLQVYLLFVYCFRFYFFF